MECYKNTVHVHNLVVLSNHYHLLVSMRQGKDLADFRRCLMGKPPRVESSVRKGPFWERRYSSQILLDDEAV